MSIKDKLAGWAAYARAEARARNFERENRPDAAAAADRRQLRAHLGSFLIAAGQLLGYAGGALLAEAHEDAEEWASQAHDAGYERHRADAAAAGDGEDQADEQLRDFSDPIKPAAGVTQYPIPRRPPAAAEPAADET